MRILPSWKGHYGPTMLAVLDAMPATFQELEKATGVSARAFRSQIQKMRYANEVHIIGYIAPSGSGKNQPILMRGPGRNAKTGTRLNAAQAAAAKARALEKEEKKPAPVVTPVADPLLLALFGR